MKNFLSNMGAGLNGSRIFLLVVILGVTIVAVPGIQISERRPAFVTDYPRESSQVLSHGWPLEYLRRSVTIEQLPQGKIEWLSPAAWSFAGNLYEFSLANLLTDLICIALGLLLLAAICWRKPKSKKQRSGWLPKISILQLLLLVSFIGLVLSWYLPHARDRKLEEQGTPYEVSQYEYRGPMWLRRTLGRNSKWLQFCHHRTRLTLDNTLYPTWKKDPVLLVQQCQRVETVSFYYVPDLEILAALKSLPRLQSLTLPLVPYIDLQKLESFKISRTKNYNSWEGNQEVREEIAGISRLKRLNLDQVNISFKDLQSLSRLFRKFKRSNAGNISCRLRAGRISTAASSSCAELETRPQIHRVPCPSLMVSTGSRGRPKRVHGAKGHDNRRRTQIRSPAITFA